jgi:hypothetical protein
MATRTRGMLFGATILVGASMGAASPAIAQAAGGGVLALRHCAGGEPMEIDLRGGEAVMLDDADRRGAAAAMGQRYPVLGPAFEPVAIVLWRRPGYGWIYVALETPREPPPLWCFSATFAAPVFDFTPALQRKYFFAGAARS